MRSRRSPGWVAPNRAPTRPLPVWLAGLLLLVGCTPSGPGKPVAPTGAAAPLVTQPPLRTAAEHGAWRGIAAPPIPPAGGMAAAWTGRELVVWGGQAGDGSRQAAGAGAAYEPGADWWQVLPPAPVAGRFGTSAVWSGREVLFWGGQAGADTGGLHLPPPTATGGLHLPPPTATFADGAAYDPATPRWRRLPAAPTGARTG